ncbi:MAG: hypothetical protein IJ660_03915 [Alphaproteobacteria bacterium]|nr:hypothetical protein [Alphaproteobacteria bacterium]
MKKDNSHSFIFRSAFLLSIVLCLLIYSSQGFAQINLSNFTEQFSPQSTKNILLKYSKQPSSDRFIFEFPNSYKVPYTVTSDNSSTKIVFSRVFRFDTQNLTSFSRYPQISQRELPENQLEITFPLPLKTSAELENSIILELSEDAQNSSQAKQQAVNPLQISSLGFSWNTPVALAVFKRGRYLWIVFNQYQPIKTDDLLKSAGHIVKDIIQLPHTAATILRIEAAGELYSEVRKEGLLWIVDLYNQKTERNLKPITINTDLTLPIKPFLQVNLPHTEDIFSFLDPDIGDIIMAITSSDPGYAFLDGYKYPDFEFLPSSQGMAINSDDFGISIIRNTVGFIVQTTQHPLNISKNLEQKKQLEGMKNRSNEINLTKELTVPIIKKSFEASEKFLLNKIKSAVPDEVSATQLELAKFYLSHGLGSNALGLLQNIRLHFIRQKKEIPAQITALTGVASFLMQRYDTAFEIFGKPECANIPEIELWRHLSDLDKERNHAPDIAKNIHFIFNYPTEIKKRLTLRGLAYAIDKQNDSLAQNFINILKELPMNNELYAALNYYDAEKIRLQGFIRSALPQYKMVALSSSNLYSALARYRIATFNSSLVDVKLNRIILEFERLRFSWGEKSFKIQILNHLVDLYLKNTDFYMALKTLHEMGELSSSQKPIIEKRMVQIMEEIYYYNNDNQFSPIKALALFDNFGYLIERSPYQTAIIIKLADRLVAIDLLDRAYKLLNDYLLQHRKNLSHEEISAMGGRLALIDLFKDNTNTAIQNLYDTAYSDISETLMLQRKIIEAKALVQEGFSDKALALLAGNNSKNATLLKAEIYWAAQQWDEASDAIRLLVERPEKDKPLSEEQIRYVLDWLTALKLAGKETIIVRIRNTFLPYFEKTPYASLFNVLSGHLEEDTISLKDIDKTIQNVQAFSDFAKQYTQSLLNTKPKKNDNSVQ